MLWFVVTCRRIEERAANAIRIEILRWLFTCLPFCLFVYSFTHLPFCLFVCLLVYSFTLLFVCLFVCSQTDQMRLRFFGAGFCISFSTARSIEFNLSATFCITRFYSSAHPIIPTDCFSSSSPFLNAPTGLSLNPGSGFRRFNGLFLRTLRIIIIIPTVCFVQPFHRLVWLLP